MKDEPREMFPIRFMSFDGTHAEKVYTEDMDANAVVDFRPSVLPVSAEDPVQVKPEDSADGPKDSSVTEPASDSDGDSRKSVTPPVSNPSPLGPPAKAAAAEKVPQSQPPFLPPLETGSN